MSIPQMKHNRESKTGMAGQEKNAFHDKEAENEQFGQNDDQTARATLRDAEPSSTAVLARQGTKKRRSFIVQPKLPSVRRFYGTVQDIRSRVPYYVSDWTEAWNYRVVSATLLIFFANVLPGIIFSLNLIETTNQYGVAEVLQSSFMAAFLFSIFGAQPLYIADVTGPIAVLNKTVCVIVKNQDDAPD